MTETRLGNRDDARRVCPLFQLKRGRKRKTKETLGICAEKFINKLKKVTEKN